MNKRDTTIACRSSLGFRVLIAPTMDVMQDFDKLIDLQVRLALEAYKSARQGCTGAHGRSSP